MRALITGASSGIGADIARVLSDKGYDIVLVARREDKLKELAAELKTNTEICCADLNDINKCNEIFEQYKDVDVLINNAGFGLFGEFCNAELDRELSMIDVNIRALHILMKKFLCYFKERNSGYILNVASSAAFLPGPLMATYYATKAYVLRLSLAIHKELKAAGSDVYVGTLCPGPVDTEFNSVANVDFNLKSLPSRYVAKYAVEKMLNRKIVIIPGVIIRMGTFITRFVPTKLLLHISYNIQKNKG